MSEIFNEWKKEGANPTLRLRSIARGEWVEGDGMRNSLEDYYATQKPIGSGSMSAIRRGMRYIVYSYAEPIAFIYPAERCVLRGKKFSRTTSKQTGVIGGICNQEGLAVSTEEDDEVFLQFVD